MLLHRLQKDELIHPPRWLPDNCQYLVYMGSTAYGANLESKNSDLDCYGFAIAPLEQTFPHLAGHIPGFGTKPQGFEVWQEHHVRDRSSGKEYDFSVYSIVKFFDLVKDNNPNMVDSLFVPDRCVLHSTKVSDLVRERRKEFLHRGSYHRFRGYAYQQLKKIEQKSNSSNPDRAADVERFGYDVKFGYHLVRLSLEAEEILTTGDLHLDQNGPLLRAIRQGEWSLDRLKEWFADKEKHLEQAFADSKLPHSADEAALKALLLQCLEHHYGSLDKAVKKDTSVDKLKAEIQAILDRN